MRNIKNISDPKIIFLLNDIRQEIRKIYGDSLKDIILYGSCARGSQESYSDVDIMILLKKKDGELREYRKRLIEVITDISIKHDVVVSVIDKNFNEFSKYANYVPFYKNVFNEGIEVYAA